MYDVDMQTCWDETPIKNANMYFLEQSECVHVHPFGERAEIGFTLTCCCRTESLLELDWRADILQTVCESEGVIRMLQICPICFCTYDNTVVKHKHFCGVFVAFCLATNENALIQAMYVQFKEKKMQSTCE